MSEENYKELRLKDIAIREAISQEVPARPQMPKDLNARLMQRVEKEVNCKPKRSVVVWPWIAAACVTALLMVFVAPSKEDASTAEPQFAKVNSDTTRQQVEIVKSDNSTIATDLNKPKTQTRVQKCTAHQEGIIASTEETIGKEEITEVVTEEIQAIQEPKAAVAEVPTTKNHPKIISECNLPIIRPENFEYTQEEIALMKKLENEAFIEQVKMELDIAKYNLEHSNLN